MTCNLRGGFALLEPVHISAVANGHDRGLPGHSYDPPEDSLVIKARKLWHRFKGVSP